MCVIEAAHIFTSLEQIPQAMFVQKGKAMTAKNAHRSLILGVVLLYSSSLVVAYQAPGVPNPPPIFVDPWVDHTPGWPAPATGGYLSKGNFNVPNGYTFIQISLLAYGEAPQNVFLETSVPASAITITGTDGSWSFLVNSPSGTFQVIGIVTLQNNLTGIISCFNTDPATGAVTVP
jgi:hypothetical protein